MEYFFFVLCGFGIGVLITVAAMRERPAGQLLNRSSKQDALPPTKQKKHRLKIVK